jgi:transposase-like protein
MRKRYHFGERGEPDAARLRSNEVPVRDIAAQFGVNRSTLYRNMIASAAA